MNIKLEASWKGLLSSYLMSAEFKELHSFISDQYNTAVVYPSQENIFKAFNLCPLDKVKVAILGQDPYHTVGAADGLAFSVAHGKSQPSLQNIFKEIQSDTGTATSLTSCSLVPWAKQGILLLNSVLTVEDALPASHAGKGWEEFTDYVIEKLSEEKENLVFILWGNYAQKKGSKIDRDKHLVIESAHPSPLAAYRGFFGSKVFTKTNKYLEKNKKNPIIW